MVPKVVFRIFTLDRQSLYDYGFVKSTIFKNEENLEQKIVYIFGVYRTYRKQFQCNYFGKLLTQKKPVQVAKFIKENFEISAQNFTGECIFSFDDSIDETRMEYFLDPELNLQESDLENSKAKYRNFLKRKVLG